ncbi:MAG: hypothetical protein K2O18_06005, partial [Oscillospiraceae bacterium]|nr:hypothetical protein [Oscillospiraceae bacterium]
PLQQFYHDLPPLVFPLFYHLESIVHIFFTHAFVVPPCFAASENRFVQTCVQCLYCFFGRLYDKYPLEFAECPSMHIKAVIHMGSQRLFL